ncbi:hypothetical protein [uncultured Sphingomonas sp.]|uniref:hypothetical protein n=1 Tax=uncultured Sphingomonas sp. TaxID=158754 RepID=UPI0035CA08B9
MARYVAFPILLVVTRRSMPLCIAVSMASIAAITLSAGASEADAYPKPTERPRLRPWLHAHRDAGGHGA